jgi:phosphoribosylformylglycinamidine synthase
MTRALVLRTAGTNCDRETCEALARAGAEVDLVHVRRLMAEPARLERSELVVFPGGFSYGDDIAAGRVLGYEVRHHLAGPFAAFVARGGYVLGVCNGFQVLVDTGLLEPPGQAVSRRRFALAPNTSARFECRWVTLRAEPSAVAWLEPGTLLPVPVAHGEGRFVPVDDTSLEALRAAGQLALRYVAPDGGPASYPDNPNGSTDDVAGVCDPSGRVLGLMPHPERNITPWHHPRWTRLGPRAEGEGLAFYRSLVDAASGAPV